MSSYPDYPFKSHFYDCNDHKMHYIAEGNPDDQAIIFVHGNPTWSFYWRHLINALSGSYYCIAPDHIGMGLSDKPKSNAYPYQLKNRIDDLESFIDSLQLKQPAHLVVHDWGGMIGSGYATRHPDKIASMTICNTAAFSLPEGVSFPWQLRVSRSPFGSLAIRGWNAFCRYAVKHCVTKYKLPNDVAKAYLAPYNNWENRIAVLRFVQDIPLNSNHPSWDTVQQVEQALSTLATIPKMFLWGPKDFVFTTGFLKHWQKLFPDTETHVFDEAGHYIIEEEHRAIIPLMTQFLAKAS